MANEEYIKETFKPDKLWACPSFTGSSFPGIKPPAEGGGGMYQIGEDLNFTLGSYSDYEIPKGTVNGDALYNAEYKAGAYVVNKGYIYNYIGDSGYYHVFVNVRNDNALGSYGAVTSGAVDFRCEILAFTEGNVTTLDGGAFCAYTCMPRGTGTIDPVGSGGEDLNIKINGVEFYSGKYVDNRIKTIYRHNITLTPEGTNGEYAIKCSVINTHSELYSMNYLIDELLSLIELGYLYIIPSDTTGGLIDLNNTLTDQAGIRFRSNPIIFMGSGITAPTWDSSVTFTVTDIVSQL